MEKERRTIKGVGEKNRESERGNVVRDNLGSKTESVKCFTLDFGVKHFTCETLNFTI